jgi:hypothetical protein
MALQDWSPLSYASIHRKTHVWETATKQDSSNTYWGGNYHYLSDALLDIVNKATNYDQEKTRGIVEHMLVAIDEKNKEYEGDDEDEDIPNVLVAKTSTTLVVEIPKDGANELVIKIAPLDYVNQH